MKQIRISGFLKYISEGRIRFIFIYFTIFTMKILLLSLKLKKSQMAESLSLLGRVELPETHILFLGPIETYWCECLGKIIKPTTPRMVNGLS